MSGYINYFKQYFIQKLDVINIVVEQKDCYLKQSL